MHAPQIAHLENGGSWCGAAASSNADGVCEAKHLLDRGAVPAHSTSHSHDQHHTALQACVRSINACNIVIAWLAVRHSVVKRMLLQVQQSV